MKTKSTLLLIAAAFAALPAAGHAQLDPDTGTLGFIINAPMPPQEHPIHPGAPQPVLVPNQPSPIALPPVHRNAQATANVPAAAQFLASVLADGKTVRLSDLMLNPEFFAAAHAVGPEADALRGQIDWLLLTGVILGFDGMDGSDDLREGYIEQENLLREGYIEQENTFRANTTLPRQEPGKNGIILGGPGNDNIILGGPGNDNLLPMTHLAPLPPFNPSVILGGPGNDNIILGGPGNDNLSSVSAGHRPN